jgi:hypothetical protein
MMSPVPKTGLQIENRKLQIVKTDTNAGVPMRHWLFFQFEIFNLQLSIFNQIFS